MDCAIYDYLPTARNVCGRSIQTRHRSLRRCWTYRRRAVLEAVQVMARFPLGAWMHSGGLGRHMGVSTRQGRYLLAEARAAGLAEYRRIDASTHLHRLTVGGHGVGRRCPKTEEECVPVLGRAGAQGPGGGVASGPHPHPTQAVRPSHQERA